MQLLLLTLLATWRTRGGVASRCPEHAIAWVSGCRCFDFCICSKQDRAAKSPKQARRHRMKSWRMEPWEQPKICLHLSRCQANLSNKLAHATSRNITLDTPQTFSKRAPQRNLPTQEAKLARMAIHFKSGNKVKERNASGGEASQTKEEATAPALIEEREKRTETA